MVDSTKVLCPLYDEIDIFIPGDSSSILPSLHKKCEILIRYVLKRNNFAAQRRYVRPLNTRRFLNPAADLISVGPLL